MSFCNSVGGVPAEQFIHERRLEPTRAPTMDGTDGTAQAGGSNRQLSVLAQIALTISVSTDGGLYAGSAAIALSRDGSGQHGSTGSR
jgi:hypothetical protein